MKKTITALDIESSGFNGYPIQIGIVKEDLTRFEILIKPPSKWLNEMEWNTSAELIHSIQLETLIEKGVDAIQVANKINAFVGKDDIYVDSHFDVKWLNILFDYTGIKKNFKMFVIDEITSEEFCSYWASIFQLELKKSGLKQHNALNDAIIIQNTYRRIAEHF